MFKSSLTVVILLLALAPAIHALQASPSTNWPGDEYQESEASTKSQIEATDVFAGTKLQAGPELWPIGVKAHGGPELWPIGVRVQAGPELWPIGAAIGSAR